MSTQTARKPAEQMTIAELQAELQAEIGRLQIVLHHKVCGDPRHFVSVAPGGVVRGCMCPAGAEKGRQGWDCPRRPIPINPMSTSVTA